MTRRDRLRALAAWTLAWPDVPALHLGSALAGWDALALARRRGELQTAAARTEDR